MKRSLAAILTAVLLCACSNNPAPKSGAPTPSPPNDFRFYTPETEDTMPATRSDTMRPVATPSPVDDYDEGLLDGEAMAEEDRLAGRPGMQSGMDDDEDEDDDFEDGFDDGYDE